MNKCKILVVVGITFLSFYCFPLRCADVEDIQTMTKRITWLLDNDKERRLMGQQGRKLVVNKHSWSKTAKAIEKIYERLL